MVISDLKKNTFSLSNIFLAICSDDIEECMLQDFDPNIHVNRNRGGGQAYDDDDEEGGGENGGVRCQQQ